MCVLVSKSSVVVARGIVVTYGTHDGCLPVELPQHVSTGSHMVAAAA